MKRGEQTVCKKSVQCMVTWLNTALHLWEMIHFNNINNAYFSIGQDEASLIRLRMEFMIDNLPDWYMDYFNKEVDTSSIKKIEFRQHGGGINLMLFKHSSGKGGRSVTFNRITLDELAFMDNGEEVWGANKPRCQYLNAFSSPPIRKSGFFYNIWSHPDRYEVDPTNLFEIHYTDFPERNPNHEDPVMAQKGKDWIAVQKRGMTQDKWDREYEGMFVSAGGLVYKFSRKLNVRSNIVLNRHWDYFDGTDFGFTHPFCTLIIAREKLGSYTRWYVLKEHYKAKMLLKDHAVHINRMKNIPIDPDEPRLKIGHLIKDSFSDAAGAQERRELRELGVITRPCRKNKGSVEAKIDKVRAAMLPLGDDKSGLIVDAACVNIIHEFENYSYPKDIDEGAHEVAPEKKFDHALDVLADVIYTLSFTDKAYEQEMTWG